MNDSLLFVANWKMNFTIAEVRDYATHFRVGFAPAQGKKDTYIAAPFTALSTAKDCFSSISGLALAAQNVHWLNNGAHTGEISVPMLRDHGVELIIVGHSERRQWYGESDANVAKRAQATIHGGMIAVVCVGEPLQIFEEGKTAQYVAKQLQNSLENITTDDLGSLVIAYEPIWAIGTGKAATPEIVDDIHAGIREKLQNIYGNVGNSVRLLYGGSTSTENIYSIMQLKNVDGVLVGGSSLKPYYFSELIKIGRTAKHESL